MPVDDLVAWAAEGSPGDSTGGENNIPPSPKCEPHASTMSHSPSRRPRSPSPRKVQLPRWYDIGHCPAACSGRCVIHAAAAAATKQQEENVTNDRNGHLNEMAESFQVHQRSHRWDKDDGQGLRLRSTSRPRGVEGKHRSSRLDLAREALLNGNVAFAALIVAEELERLTI